MITLHGSLSLCRISTRPSESLPRAYKRARKETAVKLSCLLLGSLAAVAVIAVLLLIFGVSFHHPIAQGSALYNPANEMMVSGSVIESKEFACPVSEGEMGSHVMLQTGSGVITVHLAPGRVIRSQKISFQPGDTLSVLGSKSRVTGNNDLIAREIMRGSETYILRDRDGKLLLTQ
jgi:hypothetical protein